MFLDNNRLTSILAKYCPLLSKVAWRQSGGRKSRKLEGREERWLENIFVDSSSSETIGQRWRGTWFTKPSKLSTSELDKVLTDLLPFLNIFFAFRWTILHRQPLSRCNLYLITVGNILDLKSFLVKYRNIKKTSTLPPRPGRRRKWFSFHEFFKATGTTRKSPATVTVFQTLLSFLLIPRSLFLHLYHCLDRGLQL